MSRMSVRGRKLNEIMVTCQNKLLRLTDGFFAVAPLIWMMVRYKAGLRSLGRGYLRLMDNPWLFGRRSLAKKKSDLREGFRKKRI